MQYRQEIFGDIVSRSGDGPDVRLGRLIWQEVQLVKVLQGQVTIRVLLCQTTALRHISGETGSPG